MAWMSFVRDLHLISIAWAIWQWVEQMPFRWHFAKMPDACWIFSHLCCCFYQWSWKQEQCEPMQDMLNLQLCDNCLQRAYVDHTGALAGLHTQVMPWKQQSHEPFLGTQCNSPKTLELHHIKVGDVHYGTFCNCNKHPCPSVQLRQHNACYQWHLRNLEMVSQFLQILVPVGVDLLQLVI